MNEIYRRTYTLEFDLWEPQRKLVDAEFDDLASMVKTKKLLAHAGGVRLVQSAEIRLSADAGFRAE